MSHDQNDAMIFDVPPSITIVTDGSVDIELSKYSKGEICANPSAVQSETIM